MKNLTSSRWMMMRRSVVKPARRKETTEKPETCSSGNPNSKFTGRNFSKKLTFFPPEIFVVSQKLGKLLFPNNFNFFLHFENLPKIPHHNEIRNLTRKTGTLSCFQEIFQNSRHFSTSRFHLGFHLIL